MSSLPQLLRDFYRGRRVLVTGHTGFKGAWLTLWLQQLGAEVAGLALPPDDLPLGIFHAGGLAPSEPVDVRDAAQLARAYAAFSPEIVFHLAAQAIVGVAHEDPVATFDTNVMGSVHLLECARRHRSAAAVVMVTTDKCYENADQIWGYREPDRLGGGEPYGASKACAELAIAAYTRSYFSDGKAPAVASARAGNVIGGGDWGKYRLVPDCIRALREGQPIEVRHPRATRPWQFVLDSLAGYLLLACRLADDGPRFAGAWNFGPPLGGRPPRDVEAVVRAIVRQWGAGSMTVAAGASFPESSSLQLDATKALRQLGWRTVLDVDAAVESTVAWYRQQQQSGDGDMRPFSIEQIERFEQILAEVSV